MSTSNAFTLQNIFRGKDFHFSTVHCSMLSTYINATSGNILFTIDFQSRHGFNEIST
jgi:hypothetical protein